ncbi:MAG: hydrogenase maturation protease [Actinomycetota bacterium]|nr:hydrogenase maturation protease [Actinomycetota bacterium]
MIPEDRASGERRATRVLIGGVGLPWMRDLDFGTQFVRRMEVLDWPGDVAVEDLSYAAHRVLHLLQEVQPAKVVLVGAMPRFTDVAGTVRRYLLDLTPPSDEDVQARLGDAAGGTIDLDHTLAVGRYWKAFPEDTVVIEVEPADRTFGLGFTDAVEAAMEPVLAMVRDEVGMDDDDITTTPVDGS